MYVEDIILKFKKKYFDKTIEIDTIINQEKDEVILVSIRDDFDRHEKDYYGKVDDSLCKLLIRMAIDYRVISFKDIEEEIEEELIDVGNGCTHYPEIKVSLINPFTVNVSCIVPDKFWDEQIQKNLISMNNISSGRENIFARDKRSCIRALGRYFDYELDIYNLYNEQDIDKIFNIKFNTIITDTTELKAIEQKLLSKFDSHLQHYNINYYIYSKLNTLDNSIDIILEHPDDLTIDSSIIKNIYEEFEKECVINFHFKQINKDIYYLREKLYNQLSFYNIYDYNLYLNINDKSIKIKLEYPLNKNINIDEFKKHTLTEYESEYEIALNIIKTDNFVKNDNCGGIS